MKWVKRILLTIFALLFVGLMFPTSPRGHRNSNARAENTAYNLKNAISAYFTEYQEYPILDSRQDVTLDSDHRLMDILLGSEKDEARGRNPRRIAFYTDKAAKPMDGGGYRNGIVLDTDGGGELWDTWGNRYRVRIDTDFDNRIENPEAPGTFLPESIAVWSAGKDGDFDTWKDNVKTW